MYAVRGIKTVSKSVLPVMAVLAVLITLLSLGELFIIKFIVNFALSEAFSTGKLTFYLIAYFCAAAAVNVLQNISIGGYLDRLEVKLKSDTMAKIYKKASEINLLNFVIRIFMIN